MNAGGQDHTVQSVASLAHPPFRKSTMLGDMLRLAKRFALRQASCSTVGTKVVEYLLRRKYGPRVVTPFKARNFLQVKQDIMDRAIEVKSLPLVLTLDTLSGCNLTCPFCATGAGRLDRGKKRLSLERAKTVIDAVKSHALEIRLFNWGEPFLNPDIFEIVRYASDAGLYTVISSNFSVKIKDLAEKIVESGLDVLSISMDGLEQKTLEKYRRGVDRELILDNVRKLVAARRNSGRERPRIDMAFLVFRHNEHELPLLRKMRREWAVDVFYPRRAFIYDESFIPRHHDFQPLQEMFAGTCLFLYSELTVEADGAVSPCCTNMSRKWDVGTVDDLLDVTRFWNNPYYQGMRAYCAGLGLKRARETGGGRELLCQYCGFVGRGAPRPTGLSPLPASLVAEGETRSFGTKDLEISP